MIFRAKRLALLEESLEDWAKMSYLSLRERIVMSFAKEFVLFIVFVM